jgi:nucleotide-binding universal stress UspA family protein
MRPPAFEALLHATDLSPESRPAFAHALRLAVAVGGSLRVLHARADGEHRHLPSVRDQLAEWGLVPADAHASAVAELGVAVAKVELHGDPVHAILADVERHAPDLLVLSTHARAGLWRLLQPSVAEAVLRSARTPTLVFGPAARGFVAPNGTLELRRFLVPVADEHPLGVEGAARLGRVATGPVDVRMLHVGPQFPDLPTYPHEGWTWEAVTREGSVVPTILAEATSWNSDVIVLRSLGHDSAGDLLFGSTAERVLREAPCPVLVMPGFVPG